MADNDMCRCGHERCDHAPSGFCDYCGCNGFEKVADGGDEPELVFKCASYF